MDRNNVRTSVVIELANQEEPEDQKTYQIDFDGLEIPKDYVIDQVFCGENITVYALFEVPEDENVTSNDQLLDVSSPKTAEGYRFFRKNSSKKIANPKKLNGFKQAESEESAAKHLSSKDNGTESLYCLKHLSEKYDMLTPERKNSELKILYSKSGFTKNSKSSKFKAVSKGVNTDIVQSPKIIQEVQKAVKQNIPFSKSDKRTIRDKSLPSVNSSYEVIEMEMRQSFSSLSSHGDGRKASKKSVPNFFLVPLLMMDDGVLSHFQSDDKRVEEKIVQVQPSDKISTGTNTDLAESTKTLERNEDAICLPTLKSLKLEKGGVENQKLNQKQMNSNLQPKKQNSSKLSILSEIKNLQKKLSAFIKSLESSDFIFDGSDGETADADNLSEEPATEKIDRSETNLTELKLFRKNWDKFDDVPILSSLTYPVCKKSDPNKKPTDGSTEENSDDVSGCLKKSTSMDFISIGAGSKTHNIKAEEKSKEELQMVLSDFKIDLSEVECRRGAGLSKSATTLSSLDPKFNLINGIKKSLSYALKDDKLEVSSLKKIKNISFKLDTKPNKRILQKGEGHLKCEMGDEAFHKPKNSKTDLLNLSKANKKVDNLKFDNIKLDSQKNLKEEEGDAKLVYSKKNVLSQMLGRTTESLGVHFCNTITRASENLLVTEKSLLPNPVKCKMIYNSVDTELKACSDSDKPTTPIKTIRKGNIVNCNVKREVRTLKKLTNQTNKNKVSEKPPKADGKDSTGQEVITKQRSVTSSRKFALKGTAESKPHVDRLMKPENLNNPKTTNVEKPGVKSDRTSRLPSQKREPTDRSNDVLAPMIKEKTEKMTKTTSLILLNKQDVKENREKILEKNGEVWDRTCEEGNFSPSVLNQPGVVVELLEEKPTFFAQEQEQQTNKNLKTHLPAEVLVKENPKAEESVTSNSLDMEKPVVKSVWALTKVLLFEDGTKKIEILEASLTPPGYSLRKIHPE